MKYSYVRLVASLSKSHPLFEIFTAGMVTVEKMQSVSFENIGHSFLNSRRKCNHGRHKSIKKRGAHGFSIAGHPNSILIQRQGWMAG
jgi:hypothetical protein